VKNSPLRWQSAEPAKKAGIATSSAATKDKETSYTALLGKETRTLQLNLYNPGMQRKIFWMIFAVLGLFADFMLPFWWAFAATIPILFLSWWIAYRSGWF
jgi:hypothetical protein